MRFVIYKYLSSRSYSLSFITSSSTHLRSLQVPVCEQEAPAIDFPQHVQFFATGTPLPAGKGILVEQIVYRAALGLQNVEKKLIVWWDFFLQVKNFIGQWFAFYLLKKTKLTLQGAEYRFIPWIIHSRFDHFCTNSSSFKRVFEEFNLLEIDFWPCVLVNVCDVCLSHFLCAQLVLRYFGAISAQPAPSFTAYIVACVFVRSLSSLTLLF
jgi:hypothetical protein